LKRAEQQVVVAGTPHECFDALLDYESFPDWQGASHRIGSRGSTWTAT
jgi:hypothetical protein